MFLVTGAAMSSWAPLVPYAKMRVGLDDSSLGLVLLCFGCGSLITMPLAGRVVASHGGRLVILSSATLALAMLPMLALASNTLMLASALLLFGAGLGALDVSMNLQAIVVERDAGHSMMSGFHALFSLGGIVGALSMSTMLSLGLPPVAATLAISTALACACMASAPQLLSNRSSEPGPMFGIPRGIVLLIGALCCACFLIEGAVLDWSAIFLSSTRGLDVARTGLGYAAFSVAMVIGRLTGDRVVSRFGPRSTLTSGALCAALGLAVVALVPDWRVTVIGFMVVGIGCANIVPILFTAAGRQTVMPESLALPAVTTLGYVGLLAGPAGVGLVAGQTSLALAFTGLAGLMLLSAVLGRRLPA